jgi:hypothetical protein
MLSVRNLYNESLYLGLDQSWVEEELEVDLWRLNMWSEDLIYPECDWYICVEYRC